MIFITGLPCFLKIRQVFNLSYIYPYYFTSIVKFYIKMGFLNRKVLFCPQKISRSSPPYLAPFLVGANCLVDLVLAFVFLFLLHICLLQYLRPSFSFGVIPGLFLPPCNSNLDHLKRGILATWRKYISIVVSPPKKASICLNTLSFSSKKIFVAQGQQNNTFLLQKILFLLQK